MKFEVDYEKKILRTNNLDLACDNCKTALNDELKVFFCDKTDKVFCQRCEFKRNSVNLCRHKTLFKADEHTHHNMSLKLVPE